MNEEDVTLFQQAEQLANGGQPGTAYQMFRALRDRNPEQIEVLFWIVQTTPNIVESRQTLDLIKQMQPVHPLIPQSEVFHNRKLQTATYVPPVPMTPILFCPYCGFRGPALVRDKVSTGGIITLIILLIVFFPLFWVGLLIKENYYVCGHCGARLTAVG